MDGNGPDEHKVVTLPLPLERLIQLRLAKSVPGVEPSVVVRMADGRDLNTVIADHPELYEQIVDRIVQTLDDVREERASVPMLEPPPTDLFVTTLRCTACKSITRDSTTGCESFLRGGARGETFQVGSRFEFSHDEVAADYYIRAEAPSGEEPVHVIEGWECPCCRAMNWAEIVLRDDRVASVWAVTLSPQILRRAHYVTSECVELVARLTGRPAWALLHEEVYDLLVQALAKQ